MVLLNSLFTSLFQDSDGGGGPWWVLGWLVAVGLVAWLISWLLQRNSDADTPEAPLEPVSEQTVSARAVSSEEVATDIEVDDVAASAPEGATVDVPETEADAAPAEVTATEDVEAEDTPDEANEPLLTPAPQDDLTRIEGVGPKVAGILIDSGIATYNQLANAEVEKLSEILTEAKLPLLQPDSWPEQARLAAMGDWAKLSTLQDELKSGRKVE